MVGAFFNQKVFDFYVTFRTSAKIQIIFSEIISFGRDLSIHASIWQIFFLRYKLNGRWFFLVWKFLTFMLLKGRVAKRRIIFSKIISFGRNLRFGTWQTILLFIGSNNKIPKLRILNFSRIFQPIRLFLKKKAIIT